VDGLPTVGVPKAITKFKQSKFSLESKEMEANKIGDKIKSKTAVRHKLRRKVEPTLWMDPVTHPLNRIVHITNTDASSKHLWISATLGNGD
jgi:hypothetical protein